MLIHKQPNPETAGAHVNARKRAYYEADRGWSVRVVRSSRLGPGRQVVTKLLEPAKEPSDGFVALLSIEVVGTEVAVGDAVAEDEVGGSEHRGGDGNDGLLGAAAGLEAQELGAQIAGFGADGGPGGGDEGGF